VDRRTWEDARAVPVITLKPAFIGKARVNSRHADDLVLLD
jgi:hypothetical protein